MSQELLEAIGIWLPIIIGVITALLLAFSGEPKKPET